MMEAIAIAETLTGRPMQRDYRDEARVGDHIWWVSDVSRFRSMYPQWSYAYDIRGIMADIHEGLVGRLQPGSV